MPSTGRSFERAAHLASHFGASAAPLEQLESELVSSDVVVASTASKTFVITRDLVKRVMKQRKGRTLFFIDIAVPRNIEPSVHQLDNAYVYNVDDLEHEVAENMKARQKEVAAAEKLDLRHLARMMHLLLAEGKLVRIKDGRVFHSRAIEELKARLWELRASRPIMDIGFFKELTGTSRKNAIPLLEHLDAVRVTRRVGSDREILPPARG